MRACSWILLSALAAGCGGGSSAPTERLWVSTVPTSAKQELTAFATMRTDEGKYLGAVFHGTLLRGRHDVFEWKDTGASEARVKFLQDDVEAAITVEPCKPTAGFDHCIEIGGSKALSGRYQSRKRWVVRRPGRRKDARGAFVLDVALDLAEDDADLAAAFAPAAE